MSDPTMHGSSGDWNKLKHLVDLSAENARLKAEVGELADALKLASEVGIKIADEVTRLKAEVERLRKAGDAVCESPYLWEDDPAVIAWRAAKEGKPSV